MNFMNTTMLVLASLVAQPHFAHAQSVKKVSAFKYTIPSHERYNHSDKLKIKLISCAEHLVHQKKNDLALKAIMAAMDENSDGTGGWSQNQDRLLHGIDVCHQLLSGNLSEAEASLPSSETLQNRVWAVLNVLSAPEIVACENDSLSVGGGVLFSFRAGISKLRCLFDNGRVINFVGPQLGASPGMGVSAQAVRYPVDPSAIANGKIVGFSASSAANNDLEGTEILGVTVTDGDGHRIGYGLGAEAELLFHATAGVRVLNGGRRWSMVINLLNP